MAKDNTLLYVGGAIVLVGGYFLLNKSAATPTTLVPGSVTPTIPGAPAAPLTYSDAYYKTYQYPELVKLYPNLTNSNYQLTPTDAANYMANYLELQQWAPTVVGPGKTFSTNQQAMQYHWTHYGVALQYSFIPFTPPKNASYVPPPANPSSSGSGSILSTIGSVATLLVGILGPNDEKLNDGEVELLVTMSPIVNDITKFYLKSDKRLVDLIDNRLADLVSDYKM